VQLVAAPTTGGIILSYEVARQLGVRGIFAEKVGEARRFGRGFQVAPGERTLVVDDVLTTGSSIREVLEAVRAEGGQPIGVAVLVDRTAGRVDFGLPFFACLTLELPSYDPAECPLCAQRVTLTVT
jgi:orotate phosphoribosyltransferase